MDLSRKSCLIWEYGLCVELAVRLARDFGKVFYYSPWQEDNPVSKDAMIASGLEDDGVFRCNDPWSLLDTKDEPDIWIFPHLFTDGPQKHLRSLGKKVWGGGDAENLETDRLFLKEMLALLELPVVPYEIANGMDELRNYLENTDDVKHIKVSTFRGDTETFHHHNWASTEPKVDELAHHLAGAQHRMSFLIEDDLPDAVEGGCDRIVANGQFLSPCLIGYERKNVAYIAKVVDQPPPAIAEVTDPFEVFLRKTGATQFFSNEIRVVDNTFYVTDMTTRFPSPPGELQLEIWDNLPFVMYGAAAKQIIQPVALFPYAAQITLRSAFAAEHWLHLQVPKEARQWVKLLNYCKIDGELYVIPERSRSRDCAVAVGLGDSVKEACRLAVEVAKSVEGTDIEFDEDAFESIEETIEKGREVGIEWDD